MVTTREVIEALDGVFREVDATGMAALECTQATGFVSGMSADWFRRLEQDGRTGLDMSPGDPVAAQAAEHIRYLEGLLQLQFATTSGGVKLGHTSHSCAHSAFKTVGDIEDGAKEVSVKCYDCLADGVQSLRDGKVTWSSPAPNC